MIAALILALILAALCLYFAGMAAGWYSRAEIAKLEAARARAAGWRECRDVFARKFPELTEDRKHG